MKFLDFIDEWMPYLAEGICLLWFVISLVTQDRHATLAILAAIGWAQVLFERKKREKLEKKQ